MSGNASSGRKVANGRSEKSDNGGRKRLIEENKGGVDSRSGDGDQGLDLFVMAGTGEDSLKCASSKRIGFSSKRMGFPSKSLKFSSK